MSATTPVYADVERLLVGFLPGQLGGVRVLTELPANLADVLPVVSVLRLGGTDASVALDIAVIDVDVYAGSRGAASSLAEQVRRALRFALPRTAGVRRVQTISAPAWRPYDNTALRRFGATYELTVQATSAL